MSLANFVVVLVGWCWIVTSSMQLLLPEVSAFQIPPHHPEAKMSIGSYGKQQRTVTPTTRTTTTRTRTMPVLAALGDKNSKNKKTKLTKEELAFFETRDMTREEMLQLNAENERVMNQELIGMTVFSLVISLPLLYLAWVGFFAETSEIAMQ
jgi:hypothetical protein